MEKFFHTNNTKCTGESESNSQSKNSVINTAATWKAKSKPVLAVNCMCSLYTEHELFFKNFQNHTRNQRYIYEGSDAGVQRVTKYK
jgi:hypothetical protein